MAIKRERRSHNRLNVELPIIIRPEGGVSADLRCWTLDVTTKGLLLECDNYPEGLSFDGQAAEVWLAPTAVTPSGWRSLGNAQILHSNTSENKITRIGIRFVGAERKALAIPQLVGGSIAMHNMQAQIMQAEGVNVPRGLSRKDAVFGLGHTPVVIEALHVGVIVVSARVALSIGAAGRW